MKLSVAEQDFGDSVWSHETAVRSGVVHAKGKWATIQHRWVNMESKIWHL